MTAMGTLRIVVISDTHGMHHRLRIPPGDVLVHAGDLTAEGGFDGVSQLNDWLSGVPHAHKIVIAGSHDFCFENNPERARTVLSRAHYLQDEEVTVEGVRFYGSPWHPWFMGWAFNLPRGRPLREKWDLIPEGIHVLVTHGPPFGILDTASDHQHVGCEELRRAIERVQPHVHIFGHIHEGYGMTRVGRTTFVNACICNTRYQPVNAPTVIDLPLE
jgi:predicted phosphodiesterase